MGTFQRCAALEGTRGTLARGRREETPVHRPEVQTITLTPLGGAASLWVARPSLPRIP